MIQKKHIMNIYLWTGEGAGKTTSALGVALRAAGHKQKVIIIQFLKGRKDIGEVKVANKLKPYYNIFQFGKKSWTYFNKLTKQDYEHAEKAMEFALKAIKQKPKLLILDEINLAAHFKLVKTEKVLELLDKVPSSTVVYLTGRRAPKKLINRADFVNEIKEIKKPRKYKAKKGIEY